MSVAELCLTLSLALTPFPAVNLQFSGNLTNKNINFIRRGGKKSPNSLFKPRDLWFYQPVKLPDESQEIILQPYLPKTKKKKDQSS